MASKASIRTEGDTLHLAGVLDREAVTTLWPQLARGPSPLRRLDLQQLERIDSAGLALLAELAARPGADGQIQILGTPAGLDELRAAYRLAPSLDFNASAAGS